MNPQTKAKLIAWGRNSLIGLVLILLGEQTMPLETAGLISDDSEQVSEFSYALPAGTLQFTPSVAPTPPDVPDVPVVVPVEPTTQIIDGDGLHVMLIEESSERHDLPAEQLSIINTARRYVEQHGGQLRVYDPTHDNLSADADKWQQAAARPRGSLPWVIVSNGPRNFEGPLPATLREWSELLQGPNHAHH